MKSIMPSVIALAILLSCSQAQNSLENTSDVHEFIVEEVLQTSLYTYLQGRENNQLKWVVIPKMEASNGVTYYYDRGMEMKNFKSKELNRTFESILFLEGVETTNNFNSKETVNFNHITKTPLSADVRITPAEGAITIAELYENKTDYADKMVSVTGKVVKFSPDIMNTNWIHLQDGTEYDGENDLTITSDVMASIGDVLTFEGKVVLDKDFGYGYFYKVILTEAKIVK